MRVAGLVVYRHPCDCGSASRSLGEGETAEHRFDVDGEPFPFFISEDGPSFTRLWDDLFRVDVTVYPVLAPGGDWVVVRVDEGLVPSLLIGGVRFPWAIADDGLTITVSRREMARVRLGFFCERLDTDGAVVDERLQG